MKNVNETSNLHHHQKKICKQTVDLQNIYKEVNLQNAKNS